MLRQDIDAYNGRLLGEVPNSVVSHAVDFEGVRIVGFVREDIGGRPPGH
jgi:hypothetical protein